MYGYSRREPAPVPVYASESLPVYTIEESRPRYYKRRESSSSSYTSDSRVQTVEDPPDGGTWAWIVVLACAILHICNEVVYFLFYNTIVFAHYREKNWNIPSNGTYMDFQVFEDVRLTGEIVVAFVAVFLGYRVTAVFGSVCVGAGFLGAAFVTPDTTGERQLMGFLVGFLGGIGCATWRFTAYVAIMEYFKKHRMTALILSGFGRVIGIFIGYAVISRPLQQIWNKDVTISTIRDQTEWDIYYFCELVPAGVALLASLAITPLSLATGRKRPGDCAWFLRMRSTRFCRAGMLLLLLCVYFLYYFGESLPSTTVIYWMRQRGFVTEHILGSLFAIACGVFAGYLLLAFWPRKKKLYSTLLWMGLFCLFMGLITLIFPVYTRNFVSYVSAYCILQAASQVMFDTVLRYMIPIGFGRQYIRWIEGLLGLAGGGATIANNFIIKALEDRESPPAYNYTYYFAGSSFLAAGLLAVVIIQLAICLGFKDRNREREEAEQLPPAQEMVERSRKRRKSPSRDREQSPPRYYYGYQYR